ncbi:MAG: alpha/beta fold hydrolase, partial [Coprothermobacterota bacterium]|nr:alpha/beta fold hydrolase [Coprothermobacterota bacterium]
MRKGVLSILMVIGLVLALAGTVVAASGISTLQLIVGSPVAFVNGVPKWIGGAPYQKGGEVFVPLSFIAENLGAKVRYDNNSHLITVQSPGPEMTMPYSEEKVAIESNGVKLAATLALPVRNSLSPAVLMLHGFGSSRDEVGNFYSRLAQDLAEVGIASLRLDFAGSGESGGDIADMTIQSQLMDAKAAMAYLRGLVQLDTERMGVIGFSQGGVIASALVASDPAVKSLALWSTPGDTRGTLVEELSQANFDKAAKEGIVTIDLGWRMITLKQGFFESLGASFPLKDISSYKSALLVVAGSDDPIGNDWARQFIASSQCNFGEVMI